MGNYYPSANSTQTNKYMDRIYEYLSKFHCCGTLKEIIYCHEFEKILLDYGIENYDKIYDDGYKEGYFNSTEREGVEMVHKNVKKLEEIVKFLNYGGYVPDEWQGIYTVKIGENKIEFFETSEDSEYLDYRINDGNCSFATVGDLKDLLIMFIIKEVRREDEIKKLITPVGF